MRLSRLHLLNIKIDSHFEILIFLFLLSSSRTLNIILSSSFFLFVELKFNFSWPSSLSGSSFVGDIKVNRLLRLSEQQVEKRRFSCVDKFSNSTQSEMFAIISIYSRDMFSLLLFVVISSSWIIVDAQNQTIDCKKVDIGKFKGAYRSLKQWD